MPIENVGPINQDTSSGVDTQDERKAFDNIPEAEETTEETNDEPVEEEVENEGTEEGLSEESDNEVEEETEEQPDEELETDSLYQQLKKRDPKLLKDMPELRSVLFREKQYTELFPSIEEAKDAREQTEVFSQFQRDISSGDSRTLVDALEGVGKRNLQDFVANFIPTIKEKSKDLYLGMIYPELKNLFRAASKSGNNDIKVSAENLHFFVFGNGELGSDAGLSVAKKDPRDEEITKREHALEARAYGNFFQDTSQVATKRLNFSIAKSFEGSGLSDWTVKKMSDEIFSYIDSEIKKDARHMGNMNNLWKQAKSTGYTSEGKDRIINAYLSRAKLLLSKARQKVLSDAKVSAKTGPNFTKKKPTRITPSGASFTKVSGKVDAKNVDWNKTSERDMLDGKIATRK